MKKLFFIAAIAGVALASCTKNEGAPVAADNEITFAAAVSTATKAVPGELTDAAYPTKENFNVYAVWHLNEFAGWDNGSLYMDDVKTQYAEELNGWRAIEKHYWPKNGYMTFAAYSPSDVNAESHEYTATGLKLTGFQVEADATKHVDVLYSQRSYNKQKDSENTNVHYDEVDIDFEHALSSIQFTARTYEPYTGTEIKLKKICVYGVCSKGNFDETIDETVTGYKSTPTWTKQAGRINKNTPYIYYSNSEGKVLSNERWSMNGQPYQTDLICLPQDLPESATVIVAYSINSPGKNTPEVDITLEAKLRDLAPNTWEPGKRYTYHLVIGLDEIYFAPEVAPWVPVDVLPEIEL